MPLTKRHLDTPLSYGDPKMYQSSPNDEVLANINMSTMTGTLTQLGYLASYATELFQDLFDTADQLNKRVSSCTARTRTVLADIQTMQAAVESADSSFKKMLEPKSEILSVEQQPAQQLFTPASVPSSVSARYTSDDVHPPPNFDVVEAAMTEPEREKRGPCNKLYSDPLFFFSEWQRQEMARLDVVEAERAQKKAEKKARRAKEKALKQNERGLKKTVTAKKQLNWRSRYVNDDIGGGQVIQDGPAPSLNSLVSKTTMNAGDAKMGSENRGGVKQALRSAQGGADDPHNYANSAADSASAYAQEAAVAPAPGRPAPPPRPGYTQTPAAPQQLEAPQQPASRPAPPPKPAAPGRPAPPPRPSRAAAPEVYAEEEAAPAGSRPPPPPKPAPQAPPVQQGYVDPAEFAPARPPPPAKPAPPPEPVKAAYQAPTSALNMGVLAGIGGGVKLKKAAPVEKKADPRMNMLASLKMGGNGLKKVVKEVIDKEKEEANKKAEAASGGGGMMAGVNAILERRKFLEAEDSDDDSSDEDWD